MRANLASNLLETRAGQALVAVFAVSTATILAAWAFELVGGYVPCPLCLQQRWPYYAVVPLAALLLVLLAADSPGARLARPGLVVIALIMAAGAGLAAYHAGVEWKWWAGPTTCAVGGGLSGGLPDFATARVVACDEAQWRLLGLSFAGWNFVVSLAVAGLAVWGAMDRRRPAHGSSSVSQ